MKKNFKLEDVENILGGNKAFEVLVSNSDGELMWVEVDSAKLWGNGDKYKGIGFRPNWYTIGGIRKYANINEAFEFFGSESIKNMSDEVAEFHIFNEKTIKAFLHYECLCNLLSIDDVDEARKAFTDVFNGNIINFLTDILVRCNYMLYANGSIYTNNPRYSDDYEYLYSGKQWDIFNEMVSSLELLDVINDAIDDYSNYKIKENGEVDFDSLWNYWVDLTESGKYDFYK